MKRRAIGVVLFVTPMIYAMANPKSGPRVTGHELRETMEAMFLLGCLLFGIALFLMPGRGTKRN